MHYLGALGIADAPGIHPMGIGLAGYVFDLHDLHKCLTIHPIWHKHSPVCGFGPCIRQIMRPLFTSQMNN